MDGGAWDQEAQEEAKGDAADCGRLWKKYVQLIAKRCITAEQRAAEEKKEAYRIAEVKERKARKEAEKPTVYDC